MPNNPATEYTVEEIEIDDNDAGPDDFTFVVGPSGDLKSMIIPQHIIDNPPEEIQLILELFGIDDITTLENRTLH
jgi:hypothetical protein